MTVTATLGGFSCSEDPNPLHRHAVSHPAGLWMGIHVPGLGQTTTLANHTGRYPCHTMPPHSTHRHHRGSLVWHRLRPKRRISRLQGTAAPEAAHSPDDRATRISLCASVRKDDETADFTAIGSVDDGRDSSMVVLGIN